MIMKARLKSLAPFLVIALVFLCWIVATTKHALEPEQETPPAEPGPVATPQEPETASLPAVPRPEELYGGPWSTYHGDSSLTGAVSTHLPEAPQRLWVFETDGALYTTPVASARHIHCATTKGTVYAVDTQGNEVWSKQLIRKTNEDGTDLMESFDAPIACFDETLYAGSAYDNLYALDAETGETRWTYDVGSPLLGTANLHRSGSTRQLVIIGQAEGTLHSLDPATGTPIWQTEGIDRCDGSPSVGDNTIVFGSCAAALHVFDASDGDLAHNIEIDDESQVAGGVAIVGDSVFSGSYSGALIHADASTGKIVWSNLDSKDEVFTTPAVAGGWVVFTSLDGGLYALDRATGRQLWRYETGGEPTSPVIALDKVVVGADGTLYLLELQTGKVLWSYEVSDFITAPAIIDGMIVVGSEDGTVTAFGAALE
jgi:eukaryotic-like serine/threonine-protein kinase